MKRIRTLLVPMTVVALCAFVLGAVLGQNTSAQARTPLPIVKKVFDHDLDMLKTPEIRIERISFKPNAEAPVHEHGGQVFVYVLEGTVVSQLKGGEEETFTAGDSFYEPADGVHTVTRNPSDTDSAAILAIMVKEKGTPATTLSHH